MLPLKVLGQIEAEVGCPIRVRARTDAADEMRPSIEVGVFCQPGVLARRAPHVLFYITAL